jgi:hypothetical protein
MMNGNQIGLNAVARALSPQVNASFNVHIYDGVTIVTDLDNGVSVNSDIKAVIHWLQESQALARDASAKLIYRDTHGVYDIVDLDDKGLFKCFRDLELKTEADALAFFYVSRCQ